jgi:hypothetical protein
MTDREQPLRATPSTHLISMPNCYLGTKLTTGTYPSKTVAPLAIPFDQETHRGAVGKHWYRDGVF